MSAQRSGHQLSTIDHELLDLPLPSSSIFHLVRATTTNDIDQELKLIVDGGWILSVRSERDEVVGSTGTRPHCA